MQLSALILILLLLAGLTQVISWALRRLLARSLIMAVFLVCYPADLLAVAISDEVYLTPTIYWSARTSETDFVYATLTILLAWVTATCVLALFPPPLRPGNPLLALRSGRTLVIVGLAAVLGGVVFSRVLAVGIDAALALRQSVFGDDAVTLIAYFALPVLVPFAVASFPAARLVPRVVLSFAITAALLATFLTGSRSGLFLSALLPAGIVLWRLVGRRASAVGRDILRLTLIVTTGTLVAFGGAWYLSEFRGVSTSEGFFRSTDVSQADVLIALIAEGEAPAMGSTYLAGITTLIPRSLWPEKPLPGNVVSSVILTPDRYQLTGAETTAGLLGEAFINFGFTGGIIGGLILATLLIILERLLASEDLAVWALGVLLTLRFVNVVRGDLANIAAPSLIAVAVWLLVYGGRKTASFRSRVERQSSPRSPVQADRYTPEVGSAAHADGRSWSQRGESRFKMPDVSVVRRPPDAGRTSL